MKDDDEEIKYVHRNPARLKYVDSTERIQINYVGCEGCGKTEGVIGGYCSDCRSFYFGR